MTVDGGKLVRSAHVEGGSKLHAVQGVLPRPQCFAPSSGFCRILIKAKLLFDSKLSLAANSLSISEGSLMMLLQLPIGNKCLLFLIAAVLTSSLCAGQTTLTKAGAASSTSADEPSRPNFIVILADDLGYNDLGCFGSRLIKTPNLDKIAADGVRFTDFYCAPSCTPSRAALMTGCYPCRTGFGDILNTFNGRRSPSGVLHPDSQYGINAAENTLPEILKSTGYSTGMVGKWHLGDAEQYNPVHNGFDDYFGVPYSNDMKPFYFLRGTERLQETPDNDLLTQRFTQEAVKFIRKQKDKPFFLYLAHCMPHVPVGASPAFKGKSARGPYGDAVEEVDWSVGEVVKAVADIGAEDNTLIVFLSDNGPWLARSETGGSATPLRNGKGSTYEGGVRVPCVMKWPAKIPAGKVSHGIAANMDLLPTFAALAGAKVPANRKIDGIDISALLLKPEGKSPRQSFLYYFGNQLHGVRSGEWKLRLKNNLLNEDVYRQGDLEMLEKVEMPAALYNLTNDPGEQKSVLWDRPNQKKQTHPRVSKHLNEMIGKARNDLGDSLTGVKGPNLRPIGGVEK